MLLSAVAILLLLWLLGMVLGYTFDGYIHVLMALAIVLVIVRFFRGE